MKKTFLVGILMSCVLSVFSQSDVKLLGIDLNQSLHKVIYSFASKCRAPRYISYEGPYEKGGFYDYHRFNGICDVAGVQNCFIYISGNNDKVNYIDIYMPVQGTVQDEVALRLANSITQKYGVNPKITNKQYNFKNYLFTIGNIDISISTDFVYNYTTDNTANHLEGGKVTSMRLKGNYTIKMQYWVNEITQINTNDL